MQQRDKKMKIDQNIFNLNEKEWSEVGVKVTKYGKADSEILYIFWLAAYKFGKEKLTADEITAAHYKLITKGKNPKTKKAIIMRLFLLKGGKKNDGLIQTDSKGVYMIRKPETETQYEMFKQYQDKCEQWKREYKD